MKYLLLTIKTNKIMELSTKKSFELSSNEAIAIVGALYNHIHWYCKNYSFEALQCYSAMYDDYLNSCSVLEKLGYSFLLDDLKLK